MAKFSGIIWATSAYNMSGYSAVARIYLLGIAKTGFPIRLLELGTNDDLLPSSIQKKLNELQKTDIGTNPALVIHSVPDFYKTVYWKHVPYKILCTIFETHRIPKHWVPICNSFDEVWIPSEFNRKSFSDSGVMKNKLNVFPYGIDTTLYGKNKAKLNIKGKKGFTFLYICEFSYRKGIDLLLNAFTSTFSKDDDVTLVLKISFPGIKHISPPEAKMNLNSCYPGNTWFDDAHNPNIVVLSEPFTQDQLISLINSADVYISTDRANGYGIPCLEAMALGIAAATIDWSGSTEFMKENNSLLIKPELELENVDQKLISPPYFLYKDQKWAVVKLENVKAVLRYAYNNKGKVKMLGKKGRDYVDNNLTDKLIGEKVVKHVLSLDVQLSEKQIKIYKRSDNLAYRILNKIVKVY